MTAATPSTSASASDSAPTLSSAPAWTVTRDSRGVTEAAGFRAAGVRAGLKSSGARDVALVVNHGPRRDAAAVFTTNRVKAAPVLWTEQCARAGRFSAVALNSGGANACTGPDGFADTHRTAERVAELLDIGAIEVAVCSTGLIGLRLPMDRLLTGIENAAALVRADEAGSPEGVREAVSRSRRAQTAPRGTGGPDAAAPSNSSASSDEPDAGGAAAAEAIMTTDSVAKVAHVSHPQGWTVAGMAKGAGMLAPGLATMLVVLTTDAVADPRLLDDALRQGCRLSFDRIDSDGCMSTNDTVLLLASGSSGVAPTAEEFAAAVEAVCADLARQLIGDAEGATKDIRIDVEGAATEADAVTVARAVSRSNLFKCAMHGEDPNWGRILSAVGTTDAVFDPDRIDVGLNGITVCRAGGAAAVDSPPDLSGREIVVTIDLGAGSESAWVWTNDLTAMYVHENSAYST